MEKLLSKEPVLIAGTAWILVFQLVITVVLTGLHVLMLVPQFFPNAGLTLDVYK
jgi:hypothetical protein